MKATKKGIHKHLIHPVMYLLLILNSPWATADFVGPISATLQGSGLLKDNQSNIVRINWSGNSDSSNSNSPGQPYQIYSDSGSFSVNGNTVASHGLQISDTLVIGTIAPFSISETLRIPLSVIKTAQLAHTNVISYRRVFVDTLNNQTLSASVTLKIVSASSGGLNISAIDLRFENGASSIVAGVGQKIIATAGITHAGSGLLDMVWEIATPATTSGSAVFTTLKTLRQFLVAGRYSLIESPLLPTQLSGNYLLRLRIKSPAVDFAELILRYSVLPDNNADIQIQPIQPISPLHNSRFDRSTPFSWQPLEGASSYQLEFLESSNGREGTTKKTLSTGLLLPSDRNKVLLSPIALQHLQPDQIYYWRILAIDKEGRLFGRSDDRKLLFSATP